VLPTGGRPPTSGVAATAPEAVGGPRPAGAPVRAPQTGGPQARGAGVQGGDAPWVGEGGREQMEASAALHWGLEGAEGGREGRRRTRLEREEILVAFGEGG